jgi:hypothetical protein
MELTLFLPHVDNCAWGLPVPWHITGPLLAESQMAGPAHRIVKKPPKG